MSKIRPTFDSYDLKIKQQDYSITTVDIKFRLESVITDEKDVHALQTIRIKIRYMFYCNAI